MANLKSLTVGQLRALLAQFPDATPVAVGRYSGDDWGTTFLLPLASAEAGVEAWSSYYEGVILHDGADDPGAPVVVLS